MVSGAFDDRGRFGMDRVAGMSLLGVKDIVSS